MLLLHGWYQNGNQAYAELFEHIEHKFRLIVPDLPGHGLSRYSGDFNYSVESVVHEIELLLECRLTAQNRKNFFITGHSYGGFLAMKLVLEKHIHPKHLVILAAVNDYKTYEKRLDIFLKIPRFFMPAYHFFQVLFKLFPYGDAVYFYPRRNRRTLPSRFEYAALKDFVHKPTVARKIIRSFIDVRIDPSIKDHPVSATLVYGTRDQVTPAAWGKAIQKHFLHVKLHLLEKAGHNVQLGKPFECAQIILHAARTK